MSGVAIPTEEHQRAMIQAFDGMPLPQFVVNGFGHSHSASEITSILSFGPRPVAMVVMAPVAAKSFALSLLEIVERYENATGTRVSTIVENNEKIIAYAKEHG